MTNNEIVEEVYRKYNVKEIINRLIGNSKVDTSDEDLEQYIYMTMLEYNNKKLNYLYEHSLIKPWIVRVILNQRNYYRSEYNLYLIQTDQIIINDDITQNNNNEIEYKIELENKLELIREILYNKNLSSITGFTIEEKRKYAALQLLRIYLQRKHTFTSLSKSLRISRNTISETLKYAKEIIKEEYKKKFEK